MVQFSNGRPARRPSASRPDLKVIQSSPTLIQQSDMRMLRQESGLMQSVFGDVAGLVIVTPRMLTLSQKTGVTFQNGELRIVTPSTSTLLHSLGWIKGGRKKPTSSRWYFVSAIVSAFSRLNSSCHLVRGNELVPPRETLR